MPTVTKVARKKPSKPTKTSKRPTRPSSSDGYLSRVSTERQENPIMMLVHGVGGVGKTSFAGSLPNPVFICDEQETGVDDLKAVGSLPSDLPVFPYLSNWEMLQEICQELVDNADAVPYEWVIFDSLTGLEQLCFTHHCDEAFDGDWSMRGFYNYQQGPKNAAKTVWPAFLKQLMNLRKCGYNVCLIAHSQIKNFSNPEGADFERWIPYLDREIWAITYRSVETVLFANYLINVEKDTSKGIRGKGKGGEKRFLHTEWDAAYDAKNRWGLPPVIDMGDSGTQAAKQFQNQVKKTGRP